MMPSAQQIGHVLQKIGLIPTPEQEPIIYCPNREIIVAGGERAGKSRIGSAFLTTRMFLGKLFWLVAADYERTRAEFDYICEDLNKLDVEYDASKRIDPGQINVAGGFQILTKSAKDPRQLAVKAPDGIVICEASQVDYETYLRCRGRVMETRGWVFSEGTFESSLGWYPELFNRGQGAVDEDSLISFSLPSWTNINIYPGGREDPEILRMEAEAPKDWFLERLGGVPCPPSGRVFDEFRNKFHTGVGNEYEFDSSQPVYLFVDPGYASAYAILVAQKRNDELYIVDEVYEKGKVTSDMIKICEQRPWRNQVVGGAIDIAATQHQAQVPVAEIWSKEAGIYLQSQKLGIRDGIEAVKRFLVINPITNQSLLHINARSKGLISEMGGCPDPFDGQTKVYSWKKDREGNIIGGIPDDRHNHACKALAYGIVSLFGFSSSHQGKSTRFY